MKGTAKIAYWDTAAGHRPPALLGEIKGTPTIRLFKPKAKKNRFNRKKNVLTYNFERKKKDMKHYNDRSDYQQVLTLRNYDDNELQVLIEDELDDAPDSHNQLEKVEKLEKYIERSSNYLA